MHNKQERTCIVCRRKDNQDNFLRIVRLDGEIVIDLNHKLNGRGAYICKDKSCIDLAIKKKALNRAFKCNLDKEIYSKLEEYEQNK